MTESPSNASDRLREEGPADLVPDDVEDAPEGAAREAAHRATRRANATGHLPGDPRFEPVDT